MSRQKKRQPARSFKGRLHAWYASKAPLLRFGIKFAGLLAVFYALTPTPYYQRILCSAVVADARLASAILNGLGETSRATDATIASARYSITVLPTCSAFEFPSFLCAAILSFPSTFTRKIPGILVGAAALLALNLIRVASLYWIGVHCPALFDGVHERLWGGLLTAATVLLCVAWIRWARETPNVPA